MNKELAEKLSKWYKTGNRHMKDMVKEYVYSLSFLDEDKKDKLWLSVMKRALK